MSSTGVVIRLRNLPITAGTIDIRRFFGGLSIPDGGVHIIGGDDGTAFILFSTDEDARQAMIRDGQKITSEKIKLMLSSHTEMKLMIEESQRRYEELRGLRPPEPPITNLTSRSSATGDVSSGQDAYGKEPPVDTTDANDVYAEIRGMPFNVAEDDVVTFFAGLMISAIRFMRDEKGRPTGQGFVKFKSPASKAGALKKDHEFMGPRFVRVIPATDRQWLLAGSQLCDTVRPGEIYSRKRGQNSTPTNEGTPKRSRALSPIRYDNCVELRGLPITATLKTVSDLFFHLKFVDGGLYVETDGKHCRGRAFAEFTNVNEYKEALVKDGEIVEGKQIRVIAISRQAMIEQIKQHKKYMKAKREEEYRREIEELERKEKEKIKERQIKEAQEKQRKMYEEQKRKDEEDQKKRREYQMKKQREMEEWLARQHVKEEEERKRRDLEKRIIAQEKLQEEERARKAAEQHMLEEQERRREEEMRKKEEEEMRLEFERKRQIEIRRQEERRLEDERAKIIKEEYAKYEAESMNQNGNIKEVEMDLGDESPKADLYPPPPRDALIPKHNAPPSGAEFPMPTHNASPYPPYSAGSSGAPVSHHGPAPSTSPPPSSSLPPFTSMPYQQHFSQPPPLPSQSALNPPSFSPHSGPPPTVMTAAHLPPPTTVITKPPHIPPNLPPPPIPPTMGLTGVLGAPVPSGPPMGMGPDHMFPPPLSAPVTQVQVVPVATMLPSPGIPPPMMQTVATPPAASPVTKPAPEARPAYLSKFVRIANSPFDIQEDMVRRFFRGLQISRNGVQFVMRNGRRSGHIFVKFERDEDAQHAAEKDKTVLGSREVLVQMTSPQQMTELLQKFESRKLEDLFPTVDSPKSQQPPPTSEASNHDIGENLERHILDDKLTCVRIGSVPPNVVPEDILQAFSGISIMPNGIHILHGPDGKCNGSAFLELLTPEDCARAANLHGSAAVNGVTIRIMPVKMQDMKKEMSDHVAKLHSRPPPGALPPVSPIQGAPIRPGYGMIPVGVPGAPVTIVGPPVLRLPPPLRLPEHELAMLRRGEFPGPFPPAHPGDMRDPRAPLPPMPPSFPQGMPPRGRSPTPPHMKVHRPLSPPPPRMMPPMRSRSPPPPMRRRTPSPPVRPHSPMLPPRDMMRRQEMHRRAEMDELHRRIEHERVVMRDRMRGPGPGPRRGSFDDHPHFPDGPRPRFGMDMPRFRMDGPRFPGEGPMRPRFPIDMPRFRPPMHDHVPVKMSNLSFHITQEDIIEFFIQFSPIPHSVRLMYNNTGKLTGEGLIAFPSRDAAEAAIRTLDQKSLINRKIRLALG